MESLRRPVAKREGSTLGKRIVHSLCGLIALIAVREATHAQQQWEPAGLQGERIGTIAVNPDSPNVVYVGTEGFYQDTTFHPGWIYKSTDSGESWASVLGETRAVKIVVNPIETNVVYATLGHPSSYRPGVVKSTNGGVTWAYADAGVWWEEMFSGPLLIDPHSPQTLYFQNWGWWGDVLYKTTNGGDTWSPSDSGMTEYNQRAIAMDPESTRILYTGINGSVAKTTDAGQWWFGTGAVLGSIVKVLEVDSRNPNTVFAVADYGPAPYVARSTNKGLTWQSMSFDTMGIRWVFCLAFRPNSPARWFAGADDVYTSDDDGVHWQLMSPSLGGQTIKVLAFASDGSVLYAGTYSSGVYRYNFITGVSVRAAVPEDISLHQNYPNPFNPSTKIQYSLPEDGVVSLVVCDMLGREVTTLESGFKRAGTHEAMFDASRQASGVYVYRLYAGGATLNRKMMVIK